jgi:hypothetical protein
MIRSILAFFVIAQLAASKSCTARINGKEACPATPNPDDNNFGGCGAGGMCLDKVIYPEAGSGDWFTFSGSGTCVESAAQCTNTPCCEVGDLNCQAFLGSGWDTCAQDEVCGSSCCSEIGIG